MTPRYPTRYQRKILWNALTGLAFFTIGILLACFIWLVGQALGLLQPVLVPLAVAGIIAYLLDPIVSWLQKKNLSRLKAVIVVFASFIVIFSLLAWIIIPPIVSQLTDEAKLQALNKNTSELLHNLREKPWISHWLERSKKFKTVTTTKKSENTTITTSVEGNNGGSTELEKNLNNQTASSEDSSKQADAPVPFNETRLAALLPKDIISKSAAWIRGGTSKLFGLLGVLLGFAMMPIYLYYFLKESAGIKAHWHEYVPLKASAFKDEVVDTVSEINGYLISFFRGQMLVAFIDGILVGIGLWIFGLPYGLVIGLFMAVVGVIPYIGNIICLIPACIIAYVHFGQEANQFYLGTNPWIYVAAVCAIFFVVQQINSLVTAPKIVGDSVGLHPMTVIFSMLFWSILLGGFIGALLAVPLTAAVKVLFRRYVWERQLNEPPTNEDTLMETSI